MQIDPKDNEEQPTRQIGVTYTVVRVGGLGGLQGLDGKVRETGMCALGQGVSKPTEDTSLEVIPGQAPVGSSDSVTELRKAVVKLNETARVFNIRLRFQIDEETGDLSVLVIDLEKGKVIRTIPPAKTLNMVYNLYDVVGLLFDAMV